jgi:hypothetical protein
MSWGGGDRRHVGEGASGAADEAGALHVPSFGEPADGLGLSITDVSC